MRTKLVVAVVYCVRLSEKGRNVSIVREKGEVLFQSRQKWGLDMLSSGYKNCLYGRGMSPLCWRRSKSYCERWSYRNVIWFGLRLHSALAPVPISWNQTLLQCCPGGEFSPLCDCVFGSCSLVMLRWSGRLAGRLVWHWQWCGLLCVMCRQWLKERDCRYKQAHPHWQGWGAQTFGRRLKLNCCTFTLKVAN